MNADRSLTEKELYWKDHYHWLLEQGYRLRSRYHPDWIPSWKDDKTKRMRSCEDAWNLRVERTMNDAFQVSDDRHVVLKRVSKTKFPQEVSILRYFAQEGVASDPKNHCIPLLNVLEAPDDKEHDIVVLPLLRAYDDPQFDTVGEALAFVREVLEGFSFLHQHRVAHRDVKGDNILMDSKALGIVDFNFNRPRMHRDGLNPIKPKYRRTQKWPRYHIIDFGFSSQYAPEEMPPSEAPLPASDRSLPELDAPDSRFNPFPSDVYYIGNWIRIDLIDGNPTNSLRPGFKTLDFLRPLIDDMTRREPTQRVTVDEALHRLDGIVAKLPTTMLRSQLEENTVLGDSTSTLITRSFAHWRRRLLYIVQRKPPIPSTPTPSAGPIDTPAPKDTADGAAENTPAPVIGRPIAIDRLVGNVNSATISSDVGIHMKYTPMPSAGTIDSPAPKGATDGAAEKYPEPEIGPPSVIGRVIGNLNSATIRYMPKPSDADIDTPPPQRSAPATPASASFSQPPLSPTSIPLPASPANPTF
ncbi:hypothetical protein BKA70DRAFT_137394 [Coprinopsis sp. MPI-PUGE-AT-0042]|nr:hypothetical protein BKA70DRAFT_137394 [Coprinopsis sp. MPI-PUGE-AT-0042]